MKFQTPNQQLLRYIAISILLVGTSCNVKEASSTNALSSSPNSTSSASLRWNSARFPLKVYVANNFDLSEKDSNSRNLMQQVQHNWNEADSARTYFDVSTEYTVANKEYTELEDFLDSEVGIYRASSWFSFIGSGVLAITSYLAEDRGSYREMLHADIIINDEIFTFTNDTTDNTSAYDLPSVMIHELGHLIGLKHTTSSSTPSVMQPSLGRHDVQRSLQAYDSVAIRELYNATFSISASETLAITAGNKPRYIHGYMELRADGNCVHYQDGKVVEVHQVKVKSN